VLAGAGARSLNEAAGRTHCLRGRQSLNPKIDFLTVRVLVTSVGCNASSSPAVYVIIHVFNSSIHSRNSRITLNSAEHNDEALGLNSCQYSYKHFDATNAKHTRPNLTSAVRHAFTDDRGGCFSNAVCWTKRHRTPRGRLLHSRNVNCRSSAAISANRSYD